jgi:steroid 5-alpha reductase family enzyme
VEAVADWQKSDFRSRPENAGRFISTGLWSISRHPNYAGEIVLWIGVFVLSLGGLSSNLVQCAAAAASPLFVTFLLTQVSGIPMLEKMAQKRWGGEAAYQEYVASTPVLFF